MKKSLVSIVIPAYNAEAFIEECIAATASQTYPNIEIIIVDDGSKDSTGNICRKWEKKDSRIHLYSKKNSGPSAARNFGISKATGDYLAFFDADDYPEANLISKYIEACSEWEDKSISFITCGMFFDNEYNKRVSEKISILEAPLGFAKGENYILTRSAAATLAWLKLFNFVTNKLYNLKKIKENSLSFDESIKIGEDLKFNLDYLDVCEGSIGMINTPLYHYVKRGNSNLSISYHKGDIEDTKEIYRRFIEWESKQQDVSPDNVLVIKAIYITDWVSRITSMYESCKETDKRIPIMHKITKELNSKEFRRTLREVYKARKISALRYNCLKTGRYEFFYFFRRFYQYIKG